MWKGSLRLGLVFVLWSRLLLAADGGLSVSVHTDVVGQRRTLWMQTNGGSASLILTAPTDIAGEEASGRAVLMTPDGKQGGKFAEGLARWLGQPLPPAKATATKPLPFYGSYVRLAPDGDWQRYRLILAHGSSRADVLIETTADGSEAKFVEIDPAFRATLAEMLFGALRDRFPRRTPQSDLNLTATAPLASSFQLMEGASDATVHAWPAHGGTWGAVAHGTRSTLVWWSSPDHAPADVLDVEGLITTVIPAAKGKRAAVAVLHPSREAPEGAMAYAANDPVELLVVDTDVAAPVSVIPAGQQISLAPAALWSPLGSSLAVECQDPKNARQKMLRVFDAADGHEIASTSLGRGSYLLDWTSQGVLLSSTPEETTTFYRWKPAAGQKPVVVTAPERHSPDGKYSFRLVEGAVEIIGPDGVVPFPTIFNEDRRALEYAATVRAWWIGGHQLVLVSDDLLVLDLATRKLRYLFPAERSLLLQGATSDGRFIIARDENDHLVWGRVNEAIAKGK